MSEEEKIDETEESVEVVEESPDSTGEVESVLEGVARVPNREKGNDHRPPFVMGGVFIVFIILSVIFAKTL